MRLMKTAAAARILDSTMRSSPLVLASQEIQVCICVSFLGPFDNGGETFVVSVSTVLPVGRPIDYLAGLASDDDFVDDILFVIRNLPQDVVAMK